MRLLTNECIQKLSATTRKVFPPSPRSGPMQLTDPAKKIVYFLKVSCSVVHGGSSAASNKPLQEKIGHTRAKQEGGADHNSHAILGCWGTTEGRTHLILKHSMPKI